MGEAFLADARSDVDLDPAKTAVRLTVPYGAFTQQITAYGRCYAVRFGAEEYRRHGLSSFCYGGENVADGGWAVSFSVRKQAMEHSRRCRAASRCGSRAARVPLSSNVPWTLFSSATTALPALPQLHYNCRMILLFPPVSVLQSPYLPERPRHKKSTLSTFCFPSRASALK